MFKIKKSKLTPPAVHAIEDHLDPLAFLELMAKMAILVSVEDKAKLVVPRQLVPIHEPSFQNSAHVKLLLDFQAAPDHEDPTVSPETMVAQETMANLAIKVIVETQANLANLDALETKDAPVPLASFDQQVQLRLADLESLVVQVPLVTPVEQETQVTMEHQDSPVPLEMEELPVSLDAMEMLDAPELRDLLVHLALAINAHQPVWLQDIKPSLLESCKRNSNIFFPPFIIIFILDFQMLLVFRSETVV